MLSFNVCARKASLQLTGAMLLYGEDMSRNRGHYQESVGPCIATAHQVRLVDGRPTLLPGRLINEADLVLLADGVAGASKALSTQWVDARVLARGPDRLIWWSPPGKRAMFFEKSKHNENTWAARNTCPLPGLVWMALPNDGLYVFACRGGERPSPETELYQAPLYNVWGRGKVCVGNVKLPDKQLWDVEAWEKVVFGSRFTHPNFSERNRLVKGICPVKFWKAMVTKPPTHFPEARLVKVPLKVGDLLERDILDRLNAWPEPAGEF